MRTNEKEATSSAAPSGQYQKPNVIREPMDAQDTSGEARTLEWMPRLALDMKSGGTFRLDIEREEEKRFFSTLNRALKERG